VTPRVEASFSGLLGSPRGTHRHRSDGLTVRTVTPIRLLWAPRADLFEIGPRDAGSTYPQTAVIHSVRGAESRSTSSLS